MKYIIKRKFSFTNQKFGIIRDTKRLCTAKASLSKEFNDRYNIKLSNPINKYIGENSCIVEPNAKHRQSYLIYLKNAKTKEKILGGEFFYEICGYNNYLYTIIIGRKLYKIQSCDLKDRRLTIIDMVKSKTLLQVTDPFTKSTKQYHLTINDEKWQYIYLAITILLDLHECQRNNL